MGRKGWTILIALFVGAIIGAGIGYLVAQSALVVALGAVIGVGVVAVGFWLDVVVPGHVWLALAEFSQVLECCSSFVVLSLASLVALGGLLFWHSLALAVLAGIGVMTLLLIALSVGSRSYEDTSAVR